MPSPQATAQPLPLPVLNFRSLLRETIQSEIIEEQTATASGAFLDVISMLKDDVRVYYLNRLVIESQIWPAFRANEEVVDMLMRLSMNFRFRLNVHDLEPQFNKCIEAMLNVTESVSNSYMDQDFADKLIDAKEAESFPMWLKFVLFCLVEYRSMLAAFKG